jgi:hypothetical protein
MTSKAFRDATNVFFEKQLRWRTTFKVRVELIHGIIKKGMGVIKDNRGITAELNTSISEYLKLYSLEEEGSIYTLNSLCQQDASKVMNLAALWDLVPPIKKLRKLGYGFAPYMATYSIFLGRGVDVLRFMCDDGYSPEFSIFDASIRCGNVEALEVVLSSGYYLNVEERVYAFREGDELIRRCLEQHGYVGTRSCSQDFVDCHCFAGLCFGVVSSSTFNQRSAQNWHGQGGITCRFNDETATNCLFVSEKCKAVTL